MVAQYFRVMSVMQCWILSVVVEHVRVSMFIASYLNYTSFGLMTGFTCMNTIALYWPCICVKYASQCRRVWVMRRCLSVQHQSAETETGAVTGHSLQFSKCGCSSSSSAPLIKQMQPLGSSSTYYLCFFFKCDGRKVDSWHPRANVRLQMCEGFCQG